MATKLTFNLYGVFSNEIIDANILVIYLKGHHIGIIWLESKRGVKACIVSCVCVCFGRVIVASVCRCLDIQVVVVFGSDVMVCVDRSINDC